jgi:hypothetical protein
MNPQEIRIGMQVRVGEDHRIEERRGMVGKVVGRYGGEDYVAVDVVFADGEPRLFSPRDLKEIACPRRWGTVLRYASNAQIKCRTSALRHLTTIWTGPTRT